MEITATGTTWVVSVLPRVFDAKCEECDKFLDDSSPVGLIRDLGFIEHVLVSVVAEAEIFTNVEEDGTVSLSSRLRCSLKLTVVASQSIGIPS